MIAPLVPSTLARAGAALAIALTALAASAQPAAPDNRPVTQQMGITQRQGSPLPLATAWFDESGREVTLGRFFGQGRPVLIVPVFYTCQGSCSLIIEGTMFLIRNMKEMTPGVDYELVVFSINPSENSEDAAAKESYMVERLATRFERRVDPESIHLLTGSLDSIEQLTRALGYRFILNRETMEIAHPAGIMLATPDGRIAQYFYGWEYPQRLVINSINAAKMGQVGGRAPVILFGCLMYNPATGTYVLVVQQALKVGGIATVLILALSIAVMSFRGRARQKGQERMEVSD
jgi:protein SCO1/2